MHEARNLLIRLTKVIPPGINQRHNITIDEHNNLIIYLMLGSIYYPVLLTFEDLDNDINEIVNQIHKAFIELAAGRLDAGESEIKPI